jgi:hypothetical protein
MSVLFFITSYDLMNRNDGITGLLNYNRQLYPSKNGLQPFNNVIMLILHFIIRLPPLITALSVTK